MIPSSSEQDSSRLFPEVEILTEAEPASNEASINHLRSTLAVIPEVRNNRVSSDTSVSPLSLYPLDQKGVKSRSANKIGMRTFPPMSTSDDYILTINS